MGNLPTVCCRYTAVGFVPPVAVPLTAAYISLIRGCMTAPERSLFMLKYVLRENLLTADPNDYTAQTVDSRSYTGEEIVDLMMKRGSTLTKADALAAVELYNEVCAELIADGANIVTPIFRTGLSISGVFEGATDSYDPARHTIKVNLQAGQLLQKALTTVKTEKGTAPTDTNPYIVEVIDVNSGAKNETITKGGIVQLAGTRLKFNPADETQGIFLIAEDGTETRATVIAENKPKRLMFLVPPDLATGTYILEVRTKVHDSSTELKNIKAGRFAKPVTCT